jgi:heme exporter protein D
MNLVWQNWSDFFAMGGYGLYVWGSFAVTAVVMCAEVWAVGAKRRALARDDTGEDHPHEHSHGTAEIEGSS